MGTVTVIKRGDPIKNEKGKIVGYKKGESVEVKTDPTRRQVIDVSTGTAINKTRKVVEKGKVLTKQKDVEQIRKEVYVKQLAQQEQKRKQEEAKAIAITTAQEQNRPKTINDIKKPANDNYVYKRLEEVPITTIKYETPTIYETTIKQNSLLFPERKATGLGTFDYEKEINIARGTTTETTTKTSPTGETTITRTVKPKINLNTDTSNLPKPPTDYELVGGNFGSGLEKLDTQMEKVRGDRTKRDKKSVFNLKPEDFKTKDSSYFFESALGGLKDVSIFGAQTVDYGTKLFSGRGFQKDYYNEALERINKENTLLVKGARLSFDIGLIGTASSGFAKYNSPQLVQTTTKTPLGKDYGKITKVGKDTYVSFSKSLSTTKYYVTTPKTGIIYKEGASITSKLPNLYKGASTEILYSQTTIKPSKYYPKGYQGKVSIYETSTSTVARSVNLQTKQYGNPRIVEKNLKGTETVAIGKPQTALKQYKTFYTQKTPKGILEGRTDYSYIDGKSGFFTSSGKAESNLGKISTTSTGEFKVLDKKKLVVESTSKLNFNLGKRGEFGLSRPQQTIKIEKEIPLFFRSPLASLSESQTPLSNSISKLASASVLLLDEKTLRKQKTESTMDLDIESELLKKPDVLYKPEISLASSDKLSAVSKSALKTETDTKVETKSTTLPKTQIPKLIQSKPIPTKLPTSFQPLRPKLLTFPNIRKSTVKRGLFSAQVRVKGKWLTIGKGLTKKNAINIASSFVITRSSASFKILKGGKAVTNLNLGNVFRKSKREEGVFVEKRKYRINFGQEVQEISMKARNIFKGGKK